MMSKRQDSKVPRLFAPEPHASVQHHDLDNDEPDEVEDEEANDESGTEFISNALSDTAITIPRGGSVSGGSYRNMNN